jgi:hypothetical protein
MTRLRRLAMGMSDFKCRFCKVHWSTFLQNNVQCSNSSFGDGIHNFDFKKPIKIDSHEKESSTPEVQEDKIIVQ